MHKAGPRFRSGRYLIRLCPALRLDQLHHRPRKRFWLFLRKVMAGAWNYMMGAPGGKLRSTCGAVGRRDNAVGVAVQRDGRHRNGRQRRQLALELGILRIAVGKTEAMTIAVDHDVDIVWVVERRRRPLETRIVAMPV